MYGKFFCGVYKGIRASTVACAVAFAALFAHMLLTRPVLEKEKVQETELVVDMEVGGEFHLLPNFDWPAPAFQRRDGPWVYELFTPPTIELKNGQFISHAVTDSVAESSAVLHLSHVERIPYRLQLEGFVNAPDDVMRVFIRDLETKKLHVLAEGNHVADAKFFVEHCGMRAPKEVNEATMPEVRVWDERNGCSRSLLLSDAATVGNFVVEITASLGETLETHSLSRVGEIFFVGKNPYELIHVDTERHAVTVRDGAFGHLQALSY
ncbi:MAG: hypothetical protein LBS68_00630 [Puniceicoccales bacterium]|jgi:hypothetical protein|nr:hypothetical protein [Puniceicoccales bacterium]